MNFTTLNSLDPAGHPASAPFTATYQYAEAADGAGHFQFNLRASFDGDPNGVLEDVAFVSRWVASGAGRADVIAQNGDLPIVVHATECWDGNFERVYYPEDVDASKSEGDVGACALP